MHRRLLWDDWVRGPNGAARAFWRPLEGSSIVHDYPAVNAKNLHKTLPLGLRAILVISWKSIMGGIGMLAGGLVGASGLGYAKDRFASEALEEANAAIYSEYQAEEPSKFMFFEEVIGLDGTKVGDANKALSDIRKDLAADGVTDTASAMEKLSVEQRTVIEASIEGDRQTLKADSAIPAVMAVIFLLLMLYFRSIGGYKALSMAKED